MKCASRWQNSVEKCNPHAFSPIRDLIQFTCEACGVKHSDIACQCSNCLILIHSKCVKFLGTIKIRGHVTPSLAPSLLIKSKSTSVKFVTKRWIQSMQLTVVMIRIVTTLPTYSVHIGLGRRVGQ
jgi:hypothetical protein